MNAIRILLIEDNIGDVFIIKEYLKHANLNVASIDVANDLASATQLLREKEVDLILLDLFLPDNPNQFSFHTLIPSEQNAAVVVLTGLFDENIAIEAIKIGAQDYLVKGDYDEKLLEKTIKYALERKRTEVLVKQSEEKYKILFEGNPIPMWAFDNNTNQIIMVNQAAVKHYGYTRQEFYNMKFAELGAKWRENRERNIFSEIHIKKNGEIIDVESISYEIELNDIPATLVAAYDVTLRKKSEATLKLWESVIFHTNDAILVTDAFPIDEPGPKIVYANESFTRMTGYTSKEVIGKSPRILQGPKTQRAELDKIRRALENFSSVVVDIINYKKDGTEFWVNFSIVPVANQNGVFTHFVSIQRNITEKKALEVAVREKLERQIEKQTKELKEALSKEKELVEMKNKFVATASHEFRTPLSTIKFANNFIQRHLVSLTKEQIQEKLKKIDAQTDHMTALLDDVISVGRFEAQKIPILKDKVNIKEFFFKISEEIILNNVSTHKIDVKYDIDIDSLNTDEKLMRNIFINLITNAIKFSPSESVVEVSIKNDQKHVHFNVSDKGIGISEEDLTRIFEPFHRGVNTGSIQGTGLGLSIVKKAVELLEGKVTVTSQPNKGTTFQILLPIQ